MISCRIIDINIINISVIVIIDTMIITLEITEKITEKEEKHGIIIKTIVETIAETTIEIIGIIEIVEIIIGIGIEIIIVEIIKIEM